MATRTRSASTGRTSKKKATSPPSVAGSALDDQNTERGAEQNESRAEPERDPSPSVTNAKLERREIPSFSDSREQRIAERAYWRAEQRGFAPGRELEDWLEAEKEVDEKETQQSEPRPSGL